MSMPPSKSFTSYFQSAYSQSGRKKYKLTFLSRLFQKKTSFPKLVIPSRSFIPVRMNTGSFPPMGGSFEKKFPHRQRHSRKGPTFGRLIKPLSIIGLPFVLLFVSISLYLNPLFTEPSAAPLGSESRLLLHTDGRTEDLRGGLASQQLKRFLNSESSNHVAMDDIAELTDENGNDLDLETLNPYKSRPGEENPTTLAKSSSTYKIQSGDTIWSISRKHKVGVDAVLSFNKINESKKLRPGETLKIPKLNGIYYSVRKNDSLESIGKLFSVSQPEIRKYNEVGEYLSIGTVLFLNRTRYPASYREGILGMSFMSPARGFLTSRYGMRVHPILNIPIFHTGMDIGADQGEKVRAAESGVVTFSGENAANGNFVQIKHSDGFESGYAHLSRLLVTSGKRVKKGEVIGEVGSTGLSTGPHLHFEIKQNGKFVNPARFVNLDAKPLVARR